MLNNQIDIRELKNHIEFAVHLAHEETLLLEHLPDFLVNSFLKDTGGGLESLQETEKSLLLRTLESTGGRIGEAARQLGISRATMYRKLKKYGLANPKKTSYNP